MFEFYEQGNIMQRAKHTQKRVYFAFVCANMARRIHTHTQKKLYEINFNSRVQYWIERAVGKNEHQTHDGRELLKAIACVCTFYKQ